MYNAAAYYALNKRRKQAEAKKAPTVPATVPKIQHFDMGGPVVGGALGIGAGVPLVGAGAGYLIDQIHNDPAGLAGVLGVANRYQAGNVYDPSVINQDMYRKAQVQAGQDQLAQLLYGQATGTSGPNPEELALERATNETNNQTAGLISSQRGLNPALATKMAADAAAANNSKAILNAEQLKQQRQVEATQNLGNLYGQEQQGNLGYQSLYNKSQSDANTLNQKTAAGNQQANEGIVGGIFNGIGGALSSIFGAEGGEADAMPTVRVDGGAPEAVPDYVGPMTGGTVDAGFRKDYSSMTKPKTSGAQSELGKYLSGAKSEPDSGPAVMSQGMGKFGEGVGTTIKSMGAPEEDARGGVAGRKIHDFTVGGKVPGKPLVNHNSYRNDVVPAVLSAKEIVLPLDVTLAKDAPAKAARFVAAIQAKQRGKARGKKKA